MFIFNQSAVSISLSFCRLLSLSNWSRPVCKEERESSIWQRVQHIYILEQSMRKTDAVKLATYVETFMKICSIFLTIYIQFTFTTNSIDIYTTYMYIYS